MGLFGSSKSGERVEVTASGDEGQYGYIHEGDTGTTEGVDGEGDAWVSWDRIGQGSGWFSASDLQATEKPAPWYKFW